MNSLHPLGSLLLSLLLCASPWAQAQALDWANRLRASHGLGALEEQPLLHRSAQAYAEALARSGRLSHRDGNGSTALDRYRQAGGTSIVIGEILGSGPEFSEIAAAWVRSASHREVVLDPRWTHAGAGRALRSGREVWVVVFTALFVHRLAVVLQPQGYLLSGVLSASPDREPLLLSGVQVWQWQAWDRATGEFRYLIPLSRGQLYHRLGYRDPQGRVRITDVFFPNRLATSSPEKERR